jgi:hypothetical protein
MNRHATTEQLSAYLDREIGIAEGRQLESHCSACAECGARLGSMRRVVSGLRRVFDSFRFLLFPIRPALSAGVVMGLAMVVGLFALNHEAESPMPPPTHGGKEMVTVLIGALPSQPFTTSEVAGRKFILTESGWIQRGLEGQVPVAHVDAGSPQGRALLTKCSNLEILLADGSAVVLRYHLETVEIRNLPASHLLGYEAPQVRRVARGHGRVVAA